MRSDSFKMSISKMLAFPLWVRQVIYVVLRANLERIFVNQPIAARVENLLQMYKPKITFVGKKELEGRFHDHEEVMYTFLKEVSEGKSIIEIALNCFLTLQEASRLYLDAVRNEYIMTSESDVIDATAEFFSGRIKTGEYLVKMNRLTQEQLDIAVKKQIKMKELGQQIRIAELISEMGFIKKNEIITILIMKEESKKRFIFNLNLNPQEIADSDVIKLKKEIEELRYENNYLKTKLNAILKIK